MLEVKNLCYKYDFCQGSVLAVNNINFKLNDNKILAVLGASGSGKSTLAKLLAGLLIPTNGEILLGGKNIYEIENLYSKIGITLQNPEEQLFSKTVYDELTFSLKNFGYDTEKIKNSIHNITELFDISSEILSAFPPHLSLGNQRKCAIACAVILNPELLILDEPTVGLDAQNKTDLINFVTTYKQKSKCSVIVISHDMELVSEIADEIIILKNGGKIVHDTPENILLKYEDLNVFGLQKPQINEIVQLINSEKNYLSRDIITVDEAVNQIISNTEKRGYNL